MMELKLEKSILNHFFEAVIEKYAQNDSLALVGEEPISFEEFGRRVYTLRNFLIEHGIKKGQKVVLLGENSPNWGIAFFAITTIGAVVVPILTDFPEADINHIIRHSAAAAVFIDEKFFTSYDLPALESIAGIYSLDLFSSLKGAGLKEDKIWDKLQRIPDKIYGAIKPGDKRKFRKAAEEIQEDDLAEILYTSGTTGHSKGVMLTHKNIVTNAIAGPVALGGVDENSIILNLLPLAHSYGSTTTFLGGISCGASIYFLDRKPSPKILMDAMQKLRPTIVSGVPLVFEKIYHKKVLPELTSRRILRWISKFNLGRKILYRKIGQKVLESFGGRLHSFLIGGASLNYEVEIFLREARIPYGMGYGLSECSPLVAGSFYTSLKLGSVGHIVQGVNVKIENPDPVTKVGEICVKGPNVMLGYYKNPKETKKVFTEDGWLRTGDLGYLDSDGYLFIKGRQKNVYVGPSGENIYPEIIEDKLRESLFVEESLVYVEDGKIIGRVYLDYDYLETALNTDHHDIQVKDIERILERIRRETNDKLPSFSQINKIWEQMEPFEKTPTNKIKRVLYVPDYFSK